MRKLIATGFLACLVHTTAFAETAQMLKYTYKGKFSRIQYLGDECKDVLTSNELKVDSHFNDKSFILEFSTGDKSVIDGLMVALTEDDKGLLSGSYRDSKANVHVSGLFAEILFLEVDVQLSNCIAEAQFKGYHVEE